MNEKAWKVTQWALARVGYPYVMGGTNKQCSPSYRKARAQQYPGSAANIKKYCPVLSGTLKNCIGCKYEGMECFDCAQLTRYALQYVGIELVSGATSQWNKTKWAEKGKISALPSEKVALVFRQDNSSTMGHVGIYTGDGYVIHAKGHKDGVVREKLESVKFTHYGIPAGLYSSEPEESDLIQEQVDYKALILAKIKELESLVNEL